MNSLYLHKIHSFFDLFNSVTVIAITYILAALSVFISLITIIVIPIADLPLGLLPSALGILFFIIHLKIRYHFPEKDIIFCRIFNLQYKGPPEDRPIATLLYLPLSITFAAQLVYFIDPSFAHGLLGALFKELPNAIGDTVTFYIFGYLGLYLFFRICEFVLIKDFAKNHILNIQTRQTIYMISMIALGFVTVEFLDYATTRFQLRQNIQ